MSRADARRTAHSGSFQRLFPPPKTHTSRAATGPVVFEPRVLFFSGGSNRADCTRTAINWNAVIQTLVLIRIGQELGSDSRLARALHEVVQALVTA